MREATRRIGIFDSGLGGLTVVRELLRRAPHAPFLYLGDTARVPYGNRSAQTICQYALQDVAFLIKQGATDIVVACNTVSAHALPTLRATYPEVRFFDVISPAVKRVSQLAVKRVGVIGTRATIQSDIYRQHIQRLNAAQEVISVACPLFVPLVEEGWMKMPETKRIVRHYLAPLKQKQIEALILGCTHYPLLEKEIRTSVQKRVKIIDSASALWDELSEQAPELLSSSDDPSDSQVYFFTDLSDRTRDICQRWLGRTVELTLATLE